MLAIRAGNDDMGSLPSQVALSLLELSMPQLMQAADAMDVFDVLKTVAPRVFDGPSLIQVAVGTFPGLNRPFLKALRSRFRDEVTRHVSR